MRRIAAILLLNFVTASANAWNAMGHELVAQIAYDNLTPEAKKLCNQYNNSLNRSYPAGGFVHSAIWLDMLRFKDVHWFDKMHYIDIPYSNDGSLLPTVEPVNALWAISQAVTVLSSNKASKADKGLSLRILIHIIGDIHQPLHTTALTNQQYKTGDLGGNLYPLGPNPIASNLHAYWDNGAGILAGHITRQQLKNKAHQLESKWSCRAANQLKTPKQWVYASHTIAIQQVYSIKAGSVPSKRYQLTAQNITQKQIFFAGCRLAKLLNESTQPQLKSKRVKT